MTTETKTPTVLYLLPEELRTSPEFNVRPFEGSEEAEQKRIERLAQSMEEVGQLDNLLITPERVVIAGHNRRRAGTLINQNRSALAQPLFRLRCTVQDSGDPYRQAIQSNLQRTDNSPMDVALLIGQIRAKYKWDGFKGTTKVAQFLGKSLAYVNQHERLLTLPGELQEKIHAGVITLQMALDLLKVKAEQREAMLQKAKELQNTEALTKAVDALDDAKTVQEEDQIQAKYEEDIAKSDRKIKREALVQAIREDPTAASKPLPLSRKQIVESIEQFDSPAYAKSVRDWAAYFTDKWAKGEGDAEELVRLFDAMLKKAVKKGEVAA